MENASIVALVWSEEDGLSIKQRIEMLTDAHVKIEEQLKVAVTNGC